MALAARLLRGLSAAETTELVGRLENIARQERGSYPAQIAFAQALLAAHRWSDAVAQFDKAMALATGAAAPHVGRARALAGQGDLHSAAAALRAASAIAGRAGEIPRVAHDLVAAAVAAGDPAVEVEAREIVARVERSKRATLDLASAYDRAGRPGDAAVAVAGVADVEAAQDPRRLLLEARYRAAAGELDLASSVLERARRIMPHAKRDFREELWRLAIEVARRRGELDALKAVLMRPRDVVEWEARAQVSDERGDLQDAWESLDQAVRGAPRDLGLLVRRIGVVKRVGSRDDVAHLYEDLIDTATKVEGDVSSVATDALEGLWSLGHTEAAGRLFDKLVAAGGRWRLAALRTLAEIAGRWGDDARAERSWQALLRRAPRDEVAIIGLGEAQFQQGRRAAAIETWRRLVKNGDARGESRARLAEVLVDHDLFDQALAEARIAISSSADQARQHRLLATILERQGRFKEAAAAWEVVLRLARATAGTSERREARTRLVDLWTREGTARVEAKLRELEVALRRDPGDREALMFLIEANLRTGRVDAAIAELKMVLDHNVPHALSGAATAAAPGNAGGPDRNGTSSSDGELILLLVRTLRQAQRTNEAVSWLEELSSRYPERARDANLQLAEMALAAHADERVRDLTERAASGSSFEEPRVAMRVAGIHERLGQFAEARMVYRRLVDGGQFPAATLALAASLGRSGEVDEQRSLLRHIVRESADDDMVAEAGRRAIVLEEAAGTLEQLEAMVAEAPDLSSPRGLARRRILASILGHLVPFAYRAQATAPAAREQLQRFRRHGLRALLDLMAGPDVHANGANVVELLGMLARVEAVPYLTRVINPDFGLADSALSGGTPFEQNDDFVVAVLVALGRLGSDTARAALSAVARQARPALHIPLLWALGRVGGTVGIDLAKRELAQGTTEGSVVACLTLGRAGGAGEAELLGAVAGDALRPLMVRRAAVFGLALGRHVGAVSMLAWLTDVGEPELAADARIAVRYLAVEGGRPAATPSLSLGTADEAHAISGGRLDPAEMLRALEGR